MIRKLPMIFALFVVFGFTLSVRYGFAQQNPITVLTGATLIDGTGRAAIPESVIVIDGDKFVSIGGKGPVIPATRRSSMSRGNSSSRDSSIATPTAGPFAASFI